MNRDHKVYTCIIEYDVRVEAVDSMGERTGVGSTERSTRVVTVAAPDIVYVKAWLIENPHRFVNVAVKDIRETKLDAVIELHTY